MTAVKLPTLNFPQHLRSLILKSLADPRATPDTALIIADALDEYLAEELPASSHYAPAIRTAAAAIRDHAPTLDPNARRSPAAENTKAPE